MSASTGDDRPVPDALVVRDARPTDIASLVAFNQALASETESLELDAARLRQGLEALFDVPGQARYFVAEDTAGQAVGCTMITTEYSDWRNGAFWWIQSVYVVPSHRGQGAFRRLFEHIQSAAQDDPGVVGIRLYVDKDNRDARAIYEHLGLRPTNYDLLERDFVLDRH